MGKEFNCVCDAVQNIHDLQEAVEDQCPTSCFSNLLSPTNFFGDTIPFILYTKKGEPFKAFGNIGSEDCFKTPFFRVENIDDCCATLSLLMPDCSDICGVNNLVKTAFCIEVDLGCFCAIQCLDPRLVVNSFPTPTVVAGVEDEEEEQVEDNSHGHKRRGHRH